MKAVFDTKAGSRYDDDIAVRYHFPNSMYLGIAQGCVGDWIVYREPREGGGSLAYFAVARVIDIKPDPENTTHSYALMADYLPFDAPVPFRSNGRYEEQALREMRPISAVGLSIRGRSIRPLGQGDFSSIVINGLSQTLGDVDISQFTLSDLEHDGGDGEPGEEGRRIETVLTNRVVRDASFRRSILTAYDETCAVTGFRIRDLKGRIEAQAAHILPVASEGPDIVQNGIALSATVHWLFDRHLISIGEDWRLLVAQDLLPEGVLALLPRVGEVIRLPGDQRLWPDEKFLRIHRRRFAEAENERGIFLSQEG